MEGINNAFCMSKEEYELARLATKCAGLQGKIDDQAAMIKQMALEYISDQGQWIDGIATYEALCDQLGNALQNCANNEDDVMLTREALAAWREVEGGCDVPNSE